MNREYEGKRESKKGIKRKKNSLWRWENIEEYVQERKGRKRKN